MSKKGDEYKTFIDNIVKNKVELKKTLLWFAKENESSVTATTKEIDEYVKNIKVEDKLDIAKLEKFLDKIK